MFNKIISDIRDTIVVVLVVVILPILISELKEQEPFKSNPVANETLQKTEEGIVSFFNIYTIGGMITLFLIIVGFIYYLKKVVDDRAL